MIGVGYRKLPSAGALLIQRVLRKVKAHGRPGGCSVSREMATDPVAGGYHPSPGARGVCVRSGAAPVRPSRAMTHPKVEPWTSSVNRITVKVMSKRP